MLTYNRTVTNVGAPRARSKAACVGFIPYNKTPPANLTSPGILFPALLRSCSTFSAGRTSLHRDHCISDFWNLRHAGWTVGIC
uniref:Uncharacterized protein n=1 Tax=Nelumbo nucifera TaxID=4432 RepID=A0A822Y5A0_NELNU|nr:TPA_asm: hypothetical protein HUJ06_026252 [Nelumbo nucifera]